MKKGFTLIEMAIVIAIMGMAAGGALGLYRIQAKAKYAGAGDERVEAARKAIYAYYLAAGALPCPADPALPKGDPKRGVAGDCAKPPEKDSGLIRTNARSARLAAKTLAEEDSYVRIGAVPVRALGLPEEDMAEPSGNLFIYAVTESLTQKSPPPDQAKGAIEILIPGTGKSALETSPHGAGSALYVIVNPGAEGCSAKELLPPAQENCNGDTVFSE